MEPCDDFFSGTDMHYYGAARPLPVLGLIGCTATHSLVSDICNRHSAQEPADAMRVVSVDETLLPRKKERRAIESTTRTEGILKRAWARKHQELVFGVACVMFDWDSCPVKDKVGIEQQIVAVVENARSLLKGRATRILLVLHTQMPYFDMARRAYNSTEDALNSIRRRCDLDSVKSICILHHAEIENSCIRMFRTAREASLLMYKDEIRRVKKLKGDIPKNHQGLYARHRFKVAFYYDIIGDAPGALKYYQQSYLALRQIIPGADTFPTMELKVCASIVNYRICVTMLTPNAPTADATGVRKTFEEHMNWFRFLSLHRSTFTRVAPPFASAQTPSHKDATAHSEVSPRTEPIFQPPPTLHSARNSPPPPRSATAGFSMDVVDTSTALTSAVSPSHSRGGGALAASLTLWMHHRSIAQQFERFAFLLENYLQNTGSTDIATTAHNVKCAASAFKSWRAFIAGERAEHEDIITRYSVVMQQVSSFMFTPAVYIGQECDPTQVAPQDASLESLCRDEAFWLSLFSMNTTKTVEKIISLLDNATVRYKMMRMERARLAAQAEMAGQYLEIGRYDEAHTLLSSLSGHLGKWHPLLAHVSYNLMKVYSIRNDRKAYVEHALQYVSNRFEDIDMRAHNYKQLVAYLEKDEESTDATPTPATSLLIECDSTHSFLTVSAKFESRYLFQNSQSHVVLRVATTCPQPIAINALTVYLTQGGEDKEVVVLDWPHPEFVHLGDHTVVEIPHSLTACGITTIDYVVFHVLQDGKFSIKVDVVQKDRELVAAKLMQQEYDVRPDVLKDEHHRPIARVVPPVARATIAVTHTSIVLQKEVVELTIRISSLGDTLSDVIVAMPLRNDMTVVDSAGGDVDSTGSSIQWSMPAGDDTSSNLLRCSVSFGGSGRVVVPIVATYTNQLGTCLRLDSAATLDVVCPFKTTYTLHDTLEWDCVASTEGSSPLISHTSNIPVMHRAMTWTQKMTASSALPGHAPSQPAPQQQMRKATTVNEDDVPGKQIRLTPAPVRGEFLALSTSKVANESGTVPLERFPTNRPCILNVRVENVQGFELVVEKLEIRGHDGITLNEVCVSGLPCQLEASEDVSFTALITSTVSKEMSPGTITIHCRRCEGEQSCVFYLPLPQVVFYTPHVYARMAAPERGVLSSRMPYTLEIVSRAAVPVRLSVLLVESAGFYVDGRLEWQCTLLPGARRRFVSNIFPVDVGVVTLPQFVLKADEANVHLSSSDIVSSIFVTAM